MGTSCRTVKAITAEIVTLWKNPYFGAVPYIEAMSSMNSIEDFVGLDEGREIVCRFLTNASYWRGKDARRLKKELNDLLDRGK